MYIYIYVYIGMYIYTYMYFSQVFFSSEIACALHFLRACRSGLCELVVALLNGPGPVLAALV